MHAEDRTPGSSDVWPTTRWSVVGRAVHGRFSEVDSAWNELIERYRRPVGRIVGRLARDLGLDVTTTVEDFFGYICAREILPRVDHDRGRFRCFIGAVARRWALAESRWTRRGAGTPATEAAALDEAGYADAEESEWARGVLEDAVESLIEERPRDGTLLARSFGVAGNETHSPAELCAAEGLTRNALNQALFRAKKALRGLFWERIRETTRTSKDFEHEWRVMVDRLVRAHPGLLSSNDGGGP